MKGDIPLHPTRVLDPHLTICTRCGGDGDALTVGYIMKKVVDGVTHYAPVNQLVTHDAEHGLTKGGWVDLDEGERVPMGLCHKCEEEVALHKKIVAEGGIYFRCKECRQVGVIKSSSALSADVRTQLGIEAPKPCGVEFAKCAEHTPSSREDS